MMIKLLRWSMTFIVLSSILSSGAGCRQEEVSKSETRKAPETKPAAGLPAKPAWEEDWGKSLSLGKKEQKVVIYYTGGGELVTDVSRAFKEKYGMDAEWLVVRSQELISRVMLERRGGLYVPDLVMAGGDTLLELGRQGVLEPLEPSLILPQVTDRESWLGGSLYFIDREHKVFPFRSRTGSTILINSELVRPEELKSYRNLLEPRWKGKIVVNDPSVGGAGNVFVAALYVLMGEDFLRELAKQEPIITRDQRQQVEWVARGKYSILLGPHVIIMSEFQKAGAPIKHIVPVVEGSWSGAGGGIISLMNQAPHPAAARVFLNWFLSREGQTVASKAVSEQSRRVDVSTEFIDPDRLLQRGVNYLDGESELMLKTRKDIMGLARDIFAAQLK